MEAIRLSWILLMLLLGLTFTILAYLAYLARQSPGKNEPPPTEFPRGLQMGNAPVPPVLVVSFAIIAVSVVGYFYWAWVVNPSY